MFRTTGSSFDLDGLNKQQLLQQRYDSEEEEVSECEVGQDNSFSPVDFQRCDSADVSTDELSTLDSEASDFSHLLAVNLEDQPQQPSTPDCKGSSRPVSTMTIKQNDEETGFRPGSCIYRQESDEMILELPTPDISPHLRSSTYLQPGDYEDSLRSTSPAPSCLSDDDSDDVCVAEQVTYMEPSARPNLIQISPTTSEASSRFCLDDNNSNSSSISLARQEQTDNKRSFILNYGGNEHEDEETPAPSATINCLSEVPVMPCHVSPRPLSISMVRPQTAGSEQSYSRQQQQQQSPLDMQTRSPGRSVRRPPSLMSVTNFHFPFWPARSASPQVGGGAAAEGSDIIMKHSRSNSYSPSIDQSLRSQMATPESLSRDTSFSGSVPSRNPTVKHTAAPSVGSCSTTCWSDVDGQVNVLPETETKQSKTGRKKSVRKGKSDGEKSGKTFLGLRLGKRKSVVKPVS